MPDMTAARTPPAYLPSLGVLVAGGIWGLFWFPLRIVRDAGVSVDWVNLMFFAVSAAAILPFALNRAALGRGGLDRLLTGLLLGTAFALYTLSLVMTEVVRAILLFYLTPVWSTLIGVAFLRERLTWQRLGAIALGLGGLWLIIGNDQGLPIPHNAGDWVGLAAGLCWSLGTLRSYHRPSRSVPGAVLAFSLGGLGMTAIMMALRFHLGGLSTDMPAIANMAPLVLALGVVMFTIPNIVVLWAAQRVEPARVGLLLLAEALTGTVSAALFAHEPFGVPQALGALLIVAAGAAEVTGRG
ncbi:MAG: DMT family transporter [Rhizobiaceae bacterium]|nr:MAG: DMT family transporter [Rhizobiaceae bacterium]CAG1012206.1 hypothetical protein RHIZO_04203 [Rhizobiaceae bacterium]